MTQEHEEDTVVYKKWFSSEPLINKFLNNKMHGDTARFAVSLRT